MVRRMAGASSKKAVERVQTGVRLERGLLKVLKALAEQRDIGLGDLLEGIVLHAFEGRSAFSEESLQHIKTFSELYKMKLRAEDSHQLQEDGEQ